MNNLEFFKSCLKNEFQATFDIISALPADQLDYRPHPNSRSAYEIAEHIIAHAYDFGVILTEKRCDECLELPFNTIGEGAEKLKLYWNNAIEILDGISEESFNTTPVDFVIAGKMFATIPRGGMMWFFLNDVIHHRGQLSVYIRPMGGKNPAVYGYSFDTIQTA